MGRDLPGPAQGLDPTGPDRDRIEDREIGAPVIDAAYYEAVSGLVADGLCDLIGLPRDVDEANRVSARG